MEYKGLKARYEYVVQAGMFVGEIVDCPDTISFCAKTLAELKAVMQEAVDQYLGGTPEEQLLTQENEIAI